jgi:hypothetical protein
MQGLYARLREQLYRDRHDIVRCIVLATFQSITLNLTTRAGKSAFNADLTHQGALPDIIHDSWLGVCNSAGGPGGPGAHCPPGVTRFFQALPPTDVALFISMMCMAALAVSVGWRSRRFMNCMLVFSEYWLFSGVTELMRCARAHACSTRAPAHARRKYTALASRSQQPASGSRHALTRTDSRRRITTIVVTGMPSPLYLCYNTTRLTMPVTEGGWFVPKWCNDLMFSGHISSQAIMLIFVCLSHVPVVLKVRKPRKRTRPKSTGREERRDRPAPLSPDTRSHQLRPRAHLPRTQIAFCLWVPFTALLSTAVRDHYTSDILVAVYITIPLVLHRKERLHELLNRTPASSSRERLSTKPSHRSPGGLDLCSTTTCVETPSSRGSTLVHHHHRPTSDGLEHASVENGDGEESGLRVSHRL